MAWTMAQQVAIDKRGVNILVSAAAGSGKTAVLTERVCKRVLGSKEEKGIDIDRFLIVTFTSSAAQEMKERIGEKISQYIESYQSEEHLTPEEQNIQMHLEKQLALLAKASISTIHSFCLKLIKNYFNALDIDPNVKVGNQAELQMMKLEILENLLEEEFEKEDNTPFIKVADKYGSIRGMEPLMDLILDLHTFSKSTLFPNEWLDEKVALLNADYDNLDEVAWGKALLTDFQDTFVDLDKIYEEALRLARQPEGPVLYEEVLEKDREYLHTARCETTLVKMAESIQNISFVRLPGKKQACDEVLKERVKDYREISKKIVEEMKAQTKLLNDEVLREKLKLAGEDMATLVSLVKNFDARYGEEKKEKGMLDYNDLEHMCLKLLITKASNQEKEEIKYTPIAEELADFYEELYIDEYQDSNEVQETILKAIACAKVGGPTQFMVGDMKQSIYRFRLANPKIFASKYEKWHKVIQEGKWIEEKDTTDICIDLSQNFRSRENILAATNDLFEQIMSKQVGELTYDESAKLKVGNFYTEGIENKDETDLAKHVELHIMESDSSEQIRGEQKESLDEQEEELGEQEELEELRHIELEAKMVANIIADLLSGKGNPREVFDKGLKGYRKVEPRDIVILLRSIQDKANIFEEALLLKGIDAYAETASNFFKATEIETFISLLKIIDNPRQDIPLITVLRSPIVGLDMDELVAIRLCEEEKSFFSALQTYREKGKASEKLQAFWDMLETYRSYSPHFTVEELISKLLVETGYYRYVSILPAGSKKQGNLRLLKRYASEYENNSHTGLFSFLQYLDKLEQSGSHLEEAKLTSGNDNVVRIMTIHKSKGLEFPIVFLSHTDKKFNNQDIMKRVLMHNTLGLGPKYIDDEKGMIYDTLPFVAIKNQMIKENISEEMRILYVALTRAKEKLFITGVVKNLVKQVEKWRIFGLRGEKAILPLGIKKSPTYLNWIGMSLFALKDFDTLRGIISEEANYLFEGTSKWKFRKWTKKDILIAEKEEIRLQKDKENLIETWDTSLTYGKYKEKIYERLNATYKHPFAITMPNKVTVSELKKKHTDIAQLTQSIEKAKTTPRFIEENSMQIEGARRGTIIHNVLEQIDFKVYSTKEQLGERIQELILEERLPAVAKALVDLEKLESIVKSRVIQRMLQAKVIWKEKPFVYLLKANEVEGGYPEDETILLQGVIDTCFIEEDGIVLIDYKTDYIELEKREEGIEVMKQRYALQLELYARALQGIMQMPVKEKYLYLYQIDGWVEV